MYFKIFCCSISLLRVYLASTWDLVIAQKSARLRDQVCWTNARHRSFAALRMTSPRAVILSAAKDLSPTYGHHQIFTASLHASHHFQQLVHRWHNLLTITTDTPDDGIQIATLIIRDSNTGLPKRVQIAEFGARRRIVVLAAEE